MLSVFAVDYSIQLSWQLKLQHTGGKSLDRRLMQICQTLCLTKYSNIILGSRIPTHALKVHLSGSFFTEYSRCGLVSMGTVCTTQPGPLETSFRCS